MDISEKIANLTSNILGKTNDYVKEHGVLTGLGLALTAATTVSFGSALTSIYASNMESTGQQMGNIGNFLATTLTNHAPTANGLFSYSISPEAQIIGLGVAAVGIIGALISNLYSNKNEISYKTASQLSEKFDIPISDIKKAYNTDPSYEKKIEATNSLIDHKQTQTDKAHFLNRIQKIQEEQRDTKTNTNGLKIN